MGTGPFVYWSDGCGSERIADFSAVGTIRIPYLPFSRNIGEGTVPEYIKMIIIIPPSLLLKIGGACLRQDCKIQSSIAGALNVDGLVMSLLYLSLRTTFEYWKELN